MLYSGVSANLLKQYRNLLPDRPSFDELDDLADQVPAGADGLTFVYSPAASSVLEMFVDRTAIHTRGHEVRAILEAVARELRRQVGVLCDTEWPGSVLASGGAARSRLWLAIKSSTLGCPVKAVDRPEPTSLGAYRLALGQVTPRRSAE